MQLLMDQHAISRTVGEMARRIMAEGSAPTAGSSSLALVGIRSRGELLAQRIAVDIARQMKDAAPGEIAQQIDVGALDITMYRDDLASGRAITIPQGTDMNFRLDGRVVILVDDVLQTGRSVRAALDALVDFGRPRLIRLAVLIDRGLHEFPIAADYVGMRVEAPDAHKKIVVHLKPTDAEDAAYLA